MDHLESYLKKLGMVTQLFLDFVLHHALAEGLLNIYTTVSFVVVKCFNQTDSIC